MEDDEAGAVCWTCGREIAPEEPRRLVQIPAPDPMYPLAFREAIACLDCVQLGDLDRVCSESEVLEPGAVRLFVLQIQE